MQQMPDEKRDAITTSKSAGPLIAKKSYRHGYVAVAVKLNGGGWQGDRVKIEGSTDLTTDQARALAQSLIALADEADAKVAKKAAEEGRRKAWRDREVAAGRMVRLGSL